MVSAGPKPLSEPMEPHPGAVVVQPVEVQAADQQPSGDEACEHAHEAPGPDSQQTAAGVPEQEIVPSADDQSAIPSQELDSGAQPMELGPAPNVTDAHDEASLFSFPAIHFPRLCFILTCSSCSPPLIPLRRWS